MTVCLSHVNRGGIKNLDFLVDVITGWPLISDSARFRPPVVNTTGPTPNVLDAFRVDIVDPCILKHSITGPKISFMPRD